MKKLIKYKTHKPQLPCSRCKTLEHCNFSLHVLTDNLRRKTVKDSTMIDEYEICFIFRIIMKHFLNFLINKSINIRSKNGFKIK